jgi:hypothetical protein
LKEKKNQVQPQVFAVNPFTEVTNNFVYSSSAFGNVTCFQKMVYICDKKAKGTPKSTSKLETFVDFGLGYKFTVFKL